MIQEIQVQLVGLLTAGLGRWESYSGTSGLNEQLLLLRLQICSLFQLPYAGADSMGLGTVQTTWYLCDRPMAGRQAALCQ